MPILGVVIHFLIALYFAVHAVRTGRLEQVALLPATSYAAADMHAEAGMEFAAVVERFSGTEARVEYALWALARGEHAAAQVQLKELNHSRKHMNKHTRSLHQDLFRRLDSALKMQGMQ